MAGSKDTNHSKSYKFYGQYGIDRILFHTFFENHTFLNTGISIEAGATDGIRMSNTKFFEDTFNWKSINIEPNPEQFKQLEENRPKAINIHKALSEESDQELHIKYSTDYTMRAQITTKTKHPTVHSISYSDVIKKYKIPYVTLFSLDVEGYELKVLSNMITCKVIPYVLCVEDNHVGRRNVYRMLRDQYIKIDYKFPPPVKGRKYINSFYVRKDMADMFLSNV